MIFFMQIAHSFLFNMLWLVQFHGESVDFHADHDSLDYDVELVQTKSSGRGNPHPKVFEGGF